MDVLTFDNPSAELTTKEDKMIMEGGYSVNSEAKRETPPPIQKQRRILAEAWSLYFERCGKEVRLTASDVTKMLELYELFKPD